MTEPTVVHLYLDQDALDALASLTERSVPDLCAVVQFLVCSAGAYMLVARGQVDAALSLASQAQRRPAS